MIEETYVGDRSKVKLSISIEMSPGAKLYPLGTYTNRDCSAVGELCRRLDEMIADTAADGCWRRLSIAVESVAPQLPKKRKPK